MNDTPTDGLSTPEDSSSAETPLHEAPLEATEATEPLAPQPHESLTEGFDEPSELIDQWLDDRSNEVLAGGTEGAEPGFDLPKLHKLLADLGIGSRREMEELVVAGRVSVNGVPAHVGQRISPTDQIKVNGKPVRVSLQPPPVRVLAYHKPAGEIVTKSDPQQRVTVFKNLPSVRLGRWITVGRLDVATEGLLLFTTSGELANRLMHPRNEIEREYAVRVFGQVEDHHLQALRDGVQLDDGMAKFDSVDFAGGEGSNQWVRVILKEGRNREVRRLFEAIGLTVSRLIRIRYGGIQLPPVLRRGQSADLSEPAVAALMESVGLKPRRPATGPSGARSPAGKGQSKRARASFGLPEAPISMAVMDRSDDHFDDDWSVPGHADDEWQPSGADAHLSQLAGPVKKQQGARKPNPLQTTWGAQKPSHGGLSAPQRPAKSPFGKPAGKPRSAGGMGGSGGVGGLGGPKRGPGGRSRAADPNREPRESFGGNGAHRPYSAQSAGGQPDGRAVDPGQGPRSPGGKRPPRKPRPAGQQAGPGSAERAGPQSSPRPPRPAKPRSAATPGDGSARPPRPAKPRRPRPAKPRSGPAEGGPQDS